MNVTPANGSKVLHNKCATAAKADFGGLLSAKEGTGDGRAVLISRRSLAVMVLACRFVHTSRSGNDVSPVGKQKLLCRYTTYTEVASQLGAISIYQP